jgi:FkbM family methyltransferase
VGGTLKGTARRLTRALGYEVYRTGTFRRYLDQVLEHTARLGFEPQTVIDVGVAYGTDPLYETFPRARHLLIEPIREFEPNLEAISERFDADFVLAAAGAEPGTTQLNIHRNPGCHSKFPVRAGDLATTEPRSVPMITLDEVCEEKGLAGPYLIKVDVEGAELEVLKGSQEVLNSAELVLLEVSLFELWPGAPQLHDVVRFMKATGFVAYDIYGATLRPLDAALAQVDMAFVKEDGCFRRHHMLMTPTDAERMYRSWEHSPWWHRLKLR